MSIHPINITDAEIHNPHRVIWDLLGRDKSSSSLSYPETAEALMGQSPYLRPLKEIFPIMVRLLRYYAHARCLGLDIASAKGVYPYGVLFSTLWEWRSVLNTNQVNAITRVLMAVHLYVLKKRNVVCRPEFAFLTGWTGSLQWAVPYQHLLEGARHGMSELTQLLYEVPPEFIVPTFFGNGNEKRADWERLGDPPDGEWVCTQVGLFRENYELYIHPIEDKIFEELLYLAG